MQVTKGYNHKAIKLLDDVQHKMNGMASINPLFRATVSLKLCRARSAMNKHAEAMDACESAYRALSEPGPGIHVSAARLREALEARALAHENDQNFDDAVADLCALV